MARPISDNKVDFNYPKQYYIFPHLLPASVQQSIDTFQKEKNKGFKAWMEYMVNVESLWYDFYISHSSEIEKKIKKMYQESVPDKKWVLKKKELLVKSTKFLSIEKIPLQDNINNKKTFTEIIKKTPLLCLTFKDYFYLYLKSMANNPDLLLLIEGFKAYLITERFWREK